MSAIIASVIWVAFLIGWWKLWVLMEHPWPLYFGMAVTLFLGIHALVKGNNWIARALGGVVAALSIAFVVGLLVSSDYSTDRPRGPAVGDAFPQVSLANASDGASVALIPPAGAFTFVVLFRGFW